METMQEPKEYTVFPARAGVILASCITLRPLSRIPRTGGGDPALKALSLYTFPYSPHGRG